MKPKWNEGSEQSERLDTILEEDEEAISSDQHLDQNLDQNSDQNSDQIIINNFEYKQVKGK